MRISEKYIGIKCLYKNSPNKIELLAGDNQNVEKTKNNGQKIGKFSTSEAYAIKNGMTSSSKRVFDPALIVPF